MAVSIGAVAQIIEKIAPRYWAEEWDNVGLIVGDQSAKIEHVLLTLDAAQEVIHEAEAVGAELIVAHHPILFRPLKNLRADNLAAQIPIKLLQKNIAYYAAHTNLDQSCLSSSWTIGKALNLQSMDFLAPNRGDGLIKIQVFVPEGEAVEKVRRALVEAGVGEGITDGEHSANYSECFFQGQGEGMFRPLSGANPAIGEIGTLERVNEVKLESILPERSIERAVRAMRKAHPYEEAAYDLIPLRNQGRRRGYGVIGKLSEPKKLNEVLEQLQMILHRSVWTHEEQERKSVPSEFPGMRFAGNENTIIRKIAIANGSGSSFIPEALFQGADLLITGDVDHHNALDALSAGMAVADIGHYVSEAPMIHTLASYLSQEKALKDVKITVSKTPTLPWNK